MASTHPVSHNTRRGWALVVGAALAGALLAAQLIHPYLDRSGDNARFLILAKALLTRGQYCELNFPHCPAEVITPPGYPLLLAGLMALAGAASSLQAVVLPARWLNVGLFGLSLLLLYAVLRRYARPRVALGSVALAAVSPPLLAYASLEMSEMPYLAASLAALWLLGGKGGGPEGQRASRSEVQREGETEGQEAARCGVTRLTGLTGRELVGVLALAAAFYLRSVGALLALAVAFDWLWAPARRQQALSQRLRRVASLGLLLALLCLPWLLRTAALDTAESDTYVEQLLMRDPYEQAAGRVGLAELLARGPANARSYLSDLAPNLLPDAVAWLERLPQAARSPAAWLLDLVLAGLVVGGALGQWRRGSRLLEVYAGLTLVFYLVWPWHYLRFIVPIWPFLLFYLAAALEAIAVRLASRAVIRPGMASRSLATLLLAGAVAVLLLAGLRQDLRTARYYRERRNLPTLSAFYGSIDREWGNYFAAAEWLDAHAAADAVVMARKLFLLYPVLSERPTVGYPLTRDTAVLPAELDRYGTDYIIEDAFSEDDTAERFLQPALAANPERVELVYSTEAPMVRVWRVVR